MLFVVLKLTEIKFLVSCIACILYFYWYIYSVCLLVHVSVFLRLSLTSQTFRICIQDARFGASHHANMSM